MHLNFEFANVTLNLSESGRITPKQIGCNNHRHSN